MVPCALCVQLQRQTERKEFRHHLSPSLHTTNKKQKTPQANSPPTKNAEVYKGILRN